MPMRGELPISASRPLKRESGLDVIYAWTVATIQNPEFWMVALFCAIGLLLSMAFFSDLGELVGSLNQFS